MRSNKNNYILLLVIVIICILNCKSCSNWSKAYKKYDVEFKVTGHYDNVGKLYLFCHNDTFGDYTFDVGVKTYYDVLNGDSIINYPVSYNYLISHADSDNIKEKIKNNYQYFSISEYIAKSYTILESVSTVLFLINFILCVILIDNVDFKQGCINWVFSIVSIVNLLFPIVWGMIMLF